MARERASGRAGSCTRRLPSSRRWLTLAVKSLAPRGGGRTLRIWRSRSSETRGTCSWYLRGWFDDGTPLGATASSECRIDATVQSGAVLRGPPIRYARAAPWRRSTESSSGATIWAARTRRPGPGTRAQQAAPCRAPPGGANRGVATRARRRGGPGDQHRDPARGRRGDPSGTRGDGLSCASCFGHSKSGRQPGRLRLSGPLMPRSTHCRCGASSIKICRSTHKGSRAEGRSHSRARRERRETGTCPSSTSSSS
jgi:hypothetical protein